MNINWIICLFKGHLLGPSIVQTICRNNWLKPCSRCGLYLAHGDVGTVILSKKSAMKWKEELEKEFPYMKKGLDDYDN